MDLAFSASDPFVPQDRWIATLSDGRTVFQDNTPKKPSSWRRLQQLIEGSELNITSLRLQAAGQTINMPSPSEVNGYWQASRIRKLVSPGFVGEAIDRGVGYLKDGITYIKWILPTGEIVEETRPYDPEEDLAGILHDNSD